MTPEQKIKNAILEQARAAGDLQTDEAITEENVLDIYDQENDDYQMQDYMSEFRAGKVETNLPCQWSRHYESKSVAAQMPDGSWIGWTYWYGGGKHGEPEAIDWIEDAYELECAEEEKLVTVRTFSIKNDPAEQLP